jgi:hypothetical protein
MKEVEKTTNLKEVKELASVDLKAYEEADAGTTAGEQAPEQKPEQDPEPEHKPEESEGEGAKANG